MDAWFPELQAARAHDEEPRIGGLPFGFPSHEWPRCRRCRAPMALLLQLIDGLPAVDLGARGRALYVFQCADLDRQGCCSFAPGDGGSACFVLESTQQSGQVGAAPPSEAAIETGWRLTDWERAEDLNEDPEDVPDGIVNGPSSRTKLGGAPFWIQRDETPAGPWRFLFQLETDVPPISDWIGIGGSGIASVFVRSDGATGARLVWQCS